MNGLHSERLHWRNDAPIQKKARYVLYWMQQSQRTRYNHALEFAVDQANRLRLPVLVLFGLTGGYPHANRRHYVFMVEGLREVGRMLRKRGISFGIETGPPDHVALIGAREAALVVCDQGYLRHQRQWRRYVATRATCPVVEVDSDVVVPVTSLSNKSAYAARTIRPKIHRLLPRFLVPLRSVPVKYKNTDLAPDPRFDALLAGLNLDNTAGPVSAFFCGGYSHARKRLRRFVRQHLPDYHHGRNQPHLDGTAKLSPYLHFGQIAALEIALAVHKAPAPDEAKEAFLEQLVVRRELAVNHVFHRANYDRYAGLPHWARASLDQHASDPRRPAYSQKALEKARTHDPYWNAAMMEMKTTGYIHNYMRMYWGKKILQWSASPRTAYRVLSRLNDAYFLDGRDPNSYAGVGWIFGLHDRPWKERPIFGKVRYMAHTGLERKFDIQAYVTKVRSVTALLKNDQASLTG